MTSGMDGTGREGASAGKDVVSVINARNEVGNLTNGGVVGNHNALGVFSSLRRVFQGDAIATLGQRHDHGVRMVESGRRICHSV